MDALNIVTDIIGKFMSDNIELSDQILFSIKRIKASVFEKMITMITNQSDSNNLEQAYTLYKIDRKKKEFSHHIDITGNIGDAYHTTLQADRDFIFLHTLNSINIALYLDLASKQRYTYLPSVYGSEIHRTGHQSVIIFDKVKKEVILFDPNGRSTFFDDVEIRFGGKDRIDSSILIDMIMAGFVDRFNNDTGLKYRYIPSSIWNPKKLIINRRFEKSIIGSGFCVITTILYVHLLALTEFDISVAYEMIASLSDDEMLYIISSYVSGMYEIFDPLISQKIDYTAEDMIELKKFHDVNNMIKTLNIE